MPLRVLMCMLASTCLGAQTDAESLTIAIEQFRAGDFHAARKLIEPIWTARAKGESVPSIPTLKLQFYLGQIAYQTGRGEDAVKLLRPVVDRWQKEFGENHSDTIAGVAVLGVAYREAGDWRLAIDMLKSAASKLPQITPEDKERWATVLSELATSHAWGNQLRQARNYMSQIFDALGSAAMDRHDLLVKAGQIQMMSKHPQEAIRYLERARDLPAQHPYPHKGTLHSTLGAAYYLTKRYSEAERELTLALADIEQLLGSQHEEVGYTLELLSLTQQKQKRNGEAKINSERAAAIRSLNSHSVSVMGLRSGR